jgi:hypothetical protein
MAVPYNPNGDWDLCPTGTQQVVIAWVRRIGRQRFTLSNGKEIVRDQVAIVFELAETQTRGNFAGEPFRVSRRYAYHMGSPKRKSDLRKLLEAARGREYTEAELTTGVTVERAEGANCLLEVEACGDDGNGRRAGRAMQLLANMGPIQRYSAEPPAWIAEARRKAEPEGPDERAATETEEEGLPF